MSKYTTFSMLKIETIYHHILCQALENKKFSHTQQEIAVEYGYSLSTISHALEIPTSIGAIRKTSRFFVLEDFKKLLYFWASKRVLSKDIVYSTYVAMPVCELETSVPAQSIFACYSCVTHLVSEPPADYSKVYVYLDKPYVSLAKKRFPTVKAKSPEHNLFVLKATDHILRSKNITSVPQTFVDLWGLSDWYSKDFLKVLEEKMYGILS